MKRVLAIGMYGNAMYHPLTGVDEALRGMFPGLELTMTDQFMTLCEADQHDCIVSYWDDWKEISADVLRSFPRNGPDSKNVALW